MATAMTHTAKDQHWQIDKSLTECLAHMLHNDFEYNDVTFQFNSTRLQKSKKPEAIRALQLLLVARSHVFHSMFTGDLAKGENPKIDIPDIEPHVFQELLRFIYTDEVHLTAENVTGVLYASKKYMVTNLTQKCVKFLEELLSADTAAQLLDQSILFEEEELKQKVVEKIKSEPSSVLSSEDFTQISHQALLEILQLNLKITKEIEVFEAAMKWAERQCEKLNKPTDGEHQRQVLGEAINLIRFPTMSLDDFSDIVAPTDVLTDTEGYQLMKYIVAKDKTPSLNLPFSTKPRCIHRQTSLPIRDTTIRQIIIPGPYQASFVRYHTTNLKCQLSRPIILNKLLIHSTHTSYHLTVTLSRRGRTLHSYSGVHPITAATIGTPKHQAVAVNDVHVAAGALKLNIQMQATRVYDCVVSYSPSSVSQLSDDHLTLTFPPTQDNLLLGIEYSLAD